MVKKEKSTDFWVYDLLKTAEIADYFDTQGSSIKELDNALKTASKSKTGNVGMPEFVGVIKDFLIVIEDKKDVALHQKYNEQNLICQEIDNVKNYAVNGALHYGVHLSQTTSYKKIIAIGVSGDEKRHHITPIFINERGEYKELNTIETFISFNQQNINEYYIKEILKEQTPQEKTTAEILKDAKELHEDLRNYGSIQDKDKPLLVSGILLALREMEYKNFSIDDLIGDDITTDGDKIYKAIQDHLKRVRFLLKSKKINCSINSR